MRKKYEKFGAIKIIPPTLFRPTFNFPKSKDSKLPIMV